MAASKMEVTVFIDTTLGTRLAVAVPPDVTAESFKRELERTHYSCFPTIGEIQVHQLMVKRKSFFYHISDEGFMKFAQLGVKGEHFLHAKVISLNVKTDRGSISEPAIDGHCRTFVDNASQSFEPRTNKIRGRRKKHKRRRFYCLKRFFKELDRKKNRGSKSLVIGDLSNCDRILNRLCAARIDSCTEAEEERNLSLMMECSSESSSEVISVTGIIKKYFPTFDDVKYQPKGCSSTSMGNNTNRATSLLPFPLKSNADRREFRYKAYRPEVGKRFLMASHYLGISPSKERSRISICGYRSKNLPNNCSSSLARNSLFEISDEED